MTSQQPTLRLWLDDIRPMPEGFDVLTKTAEEAIMVLQTGLVAHISLDHDLAQEHYVTGAYGSYSTVANGYTVAVWIEESVRLGKIDMPTWAVHSQNPVGAENIRQAMRKADEYAKAAVPS